MSKGTVTAVYSRPPVQASSFGAAAEGFTCQSYPKAGHRARRYFDVSWPALGGAKDLKKWAIFPDLEVVEKRPAGSDRALRGMARRCLAIQAC